MTTTGSWTDVSFEDAGESGSWWRFGSEVGDDGARARYVEPAAIMKGAEQSLHIDIPRFSRGSGVSQTLDNAKHVLVSRHPIALGALEALEVECELHVARSVDSPDYRDGFAVLGMVEVASGVVIDIIATDARRAAVLERLGSERPFTWVIDVPLDVQAHAAGSPVRLRVSAEGTGALVAAYASGSHEWCRLPTNVRPPAQFLLSVGVFTLKPLEEGRSRSVGEQGISAEWANLRYRIGG